MKRKNKARYELTLKGKGMVNRVVGFVLACALLASLVGVPAYRANADDANPCTHIHDESCYAAPEGHVCSVEEGCVPIYPTKTVEIGEPHEHDGSCYGEVELSPGHVHGEGCYEAVEAETEGEDPEASVLVCGLEEGEGAQYGPGGEPICGLEEGYVPTEEVPDEDAEPIGWICGALELVCEHACCEFGEPCLAEEIEEFNGTPEEVIGPGGGAKY